MSCINYFKILNLLTPSIKSRSIVLLMPSLLSASLIIWSLCLKYYGKSFAKEFSSFLFWIWSWDINIQLHSLSMSCKYFYILCWFVIVVCVENKYKAFSLVEKLTNTLESITFCSSEFKSLVITLIISPYTLLSLSICS